MTTINKLGKSALQLLAKKFNAYVILKEGEIPFEKFYKNGSNSFNPASLSWDYKAFLWDWEYGLVDFSVMLEVCPLWAAIKATFTEEASELRTEITRASHLAIYHRLTHDSGDGVAVEKRQLEIYCFESAKLIKWMEINKVTEEDFEKFINSPV